MVEVKSGQDERPPSIIDQLFRHVISVDAPVEVEEVIHKFLPTKEYVQKKRRLNRDIWFFKDHYSERGHTSYWTYTSDEPAYGSTRIIPIINGFADSERGNETVYCDQYNLRRTQCIFANSFITWKDELFAHLSGNWGRQAYERLLFDHDGEKTERFRILTDTSEFIQPSMQGQGNGGVFLGGGNEGDPYYTEQGPGLTILNVISRAMDGIYMVKWSTSGFSADDTGEYENDVITIYKQGDSCTSIGDSGETFKNYIEKEHKKWSEDPEGEFTGLIIGDRDVDDFSNLVNRTEDGDKLFSIFVKPNWEDIGGGYWGYRRDELIDGNIVDGPRDAARSGWDRCRSQNEKDAAKEMGIVLG